ncbi:ABC transporter ATP-binding protein [Candidatus Gottesmanbacteria bacterium RIFCSPHIGHO2_02_FULL_40_13]|uniref:ABC transporter ATP-binding protein n=1 Tax=Candidatus Gottesmanbacteria bacterium RIFCSPHIGHO2_02_FULL_40_13 TaxID=1798384 RepID=A0A1F6A6Q4_9BACT|nr:MAG: ABC transporter ATP-binding protein [Candidatus Gottesmanbacteria bacterium RIFCSPHIGHO2_02_FULL_40_13]
MIKLLNVSKQYTLEDEVFFALKKVSLEIGEGEFIGIVGPSGCGKSTLMHLIGLLDRPTEGQVKILGRDVFTLQDEERSKMRNQVIGFVFQQFNLLNKLTVLENVLLPTIYTRSKTDVNHQDKARALLQRFGIEKQINSYPNKISGGQQQRVAIARALINNPKIILADEPTGNLDSQSGKVILDLLGTLNKNDKITVIIVTHDKEVAGKTKRQIRLKDGEIV